MLIRLLVITLVATVTTTAQAQTCCLRGDVNTDLLIDGSDVAPFVATLLDPASATPRALCAADTDFDGQVNIVDVADFVSVLLDPGSALFDYGPPPPDAEAEQIGLEMLGPGGPLLVPMEIYDRIDADLDLIRAHTPALASELHSQAWLANHLLVKVLTGLPRDDYDCLNAFYQMIDEDFLFSSGGGDWYVLTFAGNLNVEALVPIYHATPEVEFAEPDSLIGGDNAWTPTPLANGKWRWVVNDGFLDCFDGCDCHRLYTFETSETGVSLISYEEFGQPWCEF